MRVGEPDTTELKVPVLLVEEDVVRFVMETILEGYLIAVIQKQEPGIQQSHTGTRPNSTNQIDIVETQAK